MMIVFPEEDGPNSLERSTLTVRTFPSTLISTFFTVKPPFWLVFGPKHNGIIGVGQGRGLVDAGFWGALRRVKDERPRRKQRGIKTNSESNYLNAASCGELDPF